MHFSVILGIIRRYNDDVWKVEEQNYLSTRIVWEKGGGVCFCVCARAHVRAAGSRDTIREDWAHYLSQLLIFEHPDANHSKKTIFHSGEKKDLCVFINPLSSDQIEVHTFFLHGKK